jgi:hypothetical protein
MSPFSAPFKLTRYLLSSIPTPILAVVPAVAAIMFALAGFQIANADHGPTTGQNAPHTFVAGNPSCSLGISSVKLEGSDLVDGGGAPLVSIDLTPDTGEALSFDWTLLSPSLVVVQVIVKAGEAPAGGGAIIYDYTGLDGTGDTNLTPPPKPAGGFFGISHIEFCFDYPPPPQLTVIKHVVNDNGGTAVASDWTMDITGTNVSITGFAGAENPGVTVTLDAGAYSVAESGGPDGYTLSASANCSGTIAAGESKTCTLTNDDDAPSLTLVKEVQNDNGGTAVATDWNLAAAGPTGFSGDGGASSDASFDQGTYDLSESAGPDGYSTTGVWSCTGTGEQTGDAQIALDLGESATCTIVNTDDAPQLTVIKHVVNDDGGSATAGDWTMDITGTDVSSTGFDGAESPGVTVTLDAGSYSVAESGGPAGYALTSSADCSGSIAVGESKTCTLTNNDVPAGDGTLRVVKVVVDGQGAVVASSGDVFSFAVNVELAQGDLTTPIPLDFTLPAAEAAYSLTETSFTGFSNLGGFVLGDFASCAAQLAENDVSLNATLSGLSVAAGETTVACWVNEQLPPPPFDVTITKIVTTSGIGVAPDLATTNYSFEFFCSDESGGSFDLKHGESKAFFEMEDGVSCSLDETVTNGATSVSGEFASQTITASNNSFTVTNNFHASPPPPPPTLVTVTIVKAVTTTGAGVAPAGAEFDMTLTCSGASDSNFSLADGGQFSRTYVQGTTCSLVETETHGADSVTGEFAGEQILTNRTFTVVNNFHADVLPFEAEITKTRTSASPAPVGSTVVFDITTTIANQTLHDAVLEDVYANQYLEFVSASIEGFALTCEVTANDPDATHNTVRCPLGDITDGTFTIVTTWIGLAEVDNTVNVVSIISDPDGPGGDAPTTVGPDDDVVILVAVVGPPEPPDTGNAGLASSATGGAASMLGLLGAALAAMLGGRWMTRREGEANA